MKKIVLMFDVLICIISFGILCVNAEERNIVFENEEIMSIKFEESELNIIEKYCVYDASHVELDYFSMEKDGIDSDSLLVHHIEGMYNVFNSMLEYDTVSLDDSGNLVYDFDDDYETQWAANYLGGNIFSGWNWLYDSDVMCLFATLGLIKSVLGSFWNINSIIKSSNPSEALANTLTTCTIALPVDLTASACAAFVNSNLNYIVGIVSGLITLCIGGFGIANIIVSAASTILGFYLPNLVQTVMMFNAAKDGRSLKVNYKLWGFTYTIQ